MLMKTDAAGQRAAMMDQNAVGALVIGSGFDEKCGSPSQVIIISDISPHHSSQSEIPLGLRIKPPTDPSLFKLRKYAVQAYPSCKSR
jgi:hypothetical protein